MYIKNSFKMGKNACKINLMEDYNDIIAENLIKLRKAQGLTQQDFAKVFNYSDKTISKWELGYSSPNIGTLKQIADYYGVTVDYFLISHQEVIDTNRRIISRRTRRLLLMSLFDLFFLLVCATIYAALATSTEQINYWPVFLWGIAALSLFNALCCNAWWKHTWSPYVFASLTIWSTLLAFYMNFIWADVHYNFWYLFFIGLPVQLAAIIILTLSHSSTID